MTSAAAGDSLAVTSTNGPVMVLDTLILLAGITALEVRDVIREPEPSRRVWKAWWCVFKPTLATQELHDWLCSLSESGLWTAET